MDAAGGFGDLSIDRCIARHGFSMTSINRLAIWSRSSARSSAVHARTPARLRSARLVLHVAAGRFDGFWEQHLKPWDGGRRADRQEARRPYHRHGSPFDPAAAHPAHPTGTFTHMLTVIREFRDGRAPKRTTD